MEPSPFETKENTKKSLALFIEEDLKKKPENKWQDSWTMAHVFNQMQKPPLTLEELRTFFDEVIINFKEAKTEEIGGEEEEIRKLFVKNKTEATYLLASYIVKKYSIITIGEKEREMFIYKDGMYYPGADNLIIFPEIQRILGSQVNKSAKTETYHKIADATAHHRSIFQETNTRYVPLKNGVYDFETKELLSHSPDYKFIYQFPITYNPSATCPKTEAFFDQVLSPDQRITVEEWLGFYFWRSYMFKKAIIFVGAGDTGKTTLLEIVTYFLGRENISSISLQKMSSDRFSAAHLYNRHGNLVDELSARDINDTGAFKMATGGGTITGEHKFGNQFAFHNFSKFTFACNRIPDVSDTNDDAYFNRWIVVRFENVIKEIIPNFINTVATEEERSGLFNLAMKGLERLLAQKKFSYDNNAEQTKNEMMRSGSSIAMFASEMLERSDGNEISKDEMYEAYVDYCKQKKLSTQTKDMLGKKLCDYTTFLSDGQSEGLTTKGNLGKIRVWRNGKFKGEDSQEKIEAEEQFNNY